MTILPKKKQPKESSNNDQHGEPPRSPQSMGNGEVRMSSHPHTHSHPYHMTRRSSPQQWDAGPQRDSRHDLEDYTYNNYFETPPTNHKKRPRSSPHRTSSRKHRYVDRNKSHSSYASYNSVSAASCHNHRSYVPSTSASTEHSSHGPSLEEGCSSKQCKDDVALVGGSLTSDNEEEIERRFEEAMKKKHLVIKPMKGDGACLFRAVADQVYGDEEMHDVVRKHCIEYMAKNADYFSMYVTEDFNAYLKRKSHNHCHGDHVEMQAICEMYNRPLEVYQYQEEPINIFQTSYKTDNAPIRLSYHGGVHYNSLVNPYQATIGVGLGLPGHQPGAADRNLLRDALRQSDEIHIEDAMLKDKLRETERDFTQSGLEELVARESFREYQEHQRRLKAETLGQGCSSSFTQKKSSTATCTSSAGCSSYLFPPECCESLSPRPRGSRSPPTTYAQALEADPPSASYYASGCSMKSMPSPQPSTSGTSSYGGAAASNIMIDPALYGFTDWQEDDVMARVIAESQEEYINSFKKKRNSSQRSSTEDRQSDGHLSDGQETDKPPSHSSLFDYKPRRRSSDKDS